MITDGVHEPTGSKRHRGAGHPWHLPSLPATPSKRCRGASSPIPCADDVPHDSPRGQQSVVPRHPADTASTDAQPGLAWPGQRRTVREHDTRGNGGGFAPLEAFCRRVAGVSRLYWCNSPPFGGGEVAVRGGVAPASQITTATNADNGVSWTRRSALWTQRRLAARGARTRTRYCERQPAISHVNPLFRVWAGLPTLTSAG